MMVSAVNPVYKTSGTAYNRRQDESDNSQYRTDIIRPDNSYDDLARQLIATYRTYQAVEDKVAPVVSRNSGNDAFFLSKEWIDESVKNSFGMSSIMYRRFLDAVEKFYLKHKSSKRLPSPHIITHRSVHFGEGLFDVEQADVAKYLELTRDRVRNFKVNSVHRISVGGVEPFYIENMRPGNFKYMILRPKLGKSGAPTVDRWEVLLFRTNLGYNVEHIDTDKNPRYNGSI